MCTYHLFHLKGVWKHETWQCYDKGLWSLLIMLVRVCPHPMRHMHQILGFEPHMGGHMQNVDVQCHSTHILPSSMNLHLILRTLVMI
jgi:hypothetical protein